jgi:acylphosphatase
MEACAQIVVKGLVQGVGFRYFIYRHATNLGLSGFTKNLYDGSVEIEAQGNRSAIEELIKLVKVGPRSAQVTDLKIDWKESPNQYTHFDIR